jgi:hypothetical protein
MSKYSIMILLVLGFVSYAQAQLLTNHQVVRCVEFERQVDPFDDGAVITLNMGYCEHSKFDLQLLNSRVMEGLRTVLKDQSINRQTSYSDLVSKHKLDLEKMRDLQIWVANSLLSQDKCSALFYEKFPELVMQHLQSPETFKQMSGYVNAYEITRQFAQGMICERLPK